MSIEEKAVKVGVKGLAKLADIYRRWRTKFARKRKGEIYVKLSLLLTLATSGCASLDSAYIALDDHAFNSSTAKQAVPEGYDVVWDVYDGARNKVDISGYYRLPRLEPKADAPVNKIDASILPDPNKPKTAKEEVLDLIRTEAAGDNSDILEQVKDAIK